MLIFAKVFTPIFSQQHFSNTVHLLKDVIVDESFIFKVYPQFIILNYKDSIRSIGIVLCIKDVYQNCIDSCKYS